MDGGIYKMEKKKLFELSEKINVLLSSEFKDESIIDVAAATIFVLGMMTSGSGDEFVLPETICRQALRKLDSVKR